MSKQAPIKQRVVEALREHAEALHEEARLSLSTEALLIASAHEKQVLALIAELADKAIVPREPDKAMRDAGGWVVNDCRQTDLKTNGNDVATLAFRAMLRASDEQ